MDYLYEAGIPYRHLGLGERPDIHEKPLSYWRLHLPTKQVSHGEIAFVGSEIAGLKLLNYWNSQKDWKYSTYVLEQ